MKYRKPVLFLSTLLLGSFLGLACDKVTPSEPERVNPLDQENSVTEGDPFALTATVDAAGVHQEVELGPTLVAGDRRGRIRGRGVGQGGRVPANVIDEVGHRGEVTPRGSPNVHVTIAARRRYRLGNGRSPLLRVERGVGAPGA